MRWLGFEAQNDTWETAEAMFKDVPAITKAYLQELRHNDLIDKFLVDKGLEPKGTERYVAGRRQRRSRK